MRIGQAVQAVLSQTEFLFQRFGAVVVGVDHATVCAGAGEHFAHQLAVPRFFHQCCLGHRGGWGVADDGDEIVDVGQCHGQAFQHMTAVARLAQLKHGAACDHFPAMLQEDLDQILQVAQLGLTIHQRHHVHAEGVLQLGLLVQVVQHHLRHFAALEFDHQAHAGLVGLVLDVADAFDFLLVHQLGHTLLQRLFVDLIGQLINDDGLALATIDVLKVHLGTHHHATTAGAITFLDAVDAVDDAGGGEIRRWHDFHQIVHAGFWVVQQVQACIHHFIQIVRRNVRGHAHGNTGRAVHQQIGQAGWKRQRFAFGAVIVGAEIHGFLVDITQHFVGNLGQTNFRVTHGRCAVAVDRAKVTLAIHQHVTQREVLRHTHDRVVHRTVTVWVVFTDHITNDTRRLLVRAVPVVVEFVHGIQHTSMHRLQAIARVGEGAAHNHAHGVIKVAAAHFLF